jgi:Flp pilus assembly protein TadG
MNLDRAFEVIKSGAVQAMSMDIFSTLRALNRRGRQLLRGNQRGTAVIEFAMVAAPFAALLLAIAQTSLVFFAQQNLETSAQTVARQLTTGAVQKAKMSQADFTALVCTKLPAFMDCSNLLIDLRVVNNFASANTGMPTLSYDADGKITNTWNYQPGNPGDVQVLRVMYVWRVSGAPLGFDLSNMSNSRRMLVATSVFKTEPY